MPNNYFQFKEFRIDQGNCGMKVTTEACLFGALVDVFDTQIKLKVLDIGAGTGLLSLMIAQRFPKALITAVEIDENAFREASLNIKNSPWSNRINIINQSIQAFEQESQELYDLIICNPPFFSDHQKGLDRQKSTALHTDSLSHDDLACIVEKLLNKIGEFYVLLPSFEAKKIERQLNSLKLSAHQSIEVYNRIQDINIFRNIRAYSRNNHPLKEKKFFIRNSQNEYTAEFKKLMKPFYLHL